MTSARLRFEDGYSTSPGDAPSSFVVAPTINCFRHSGKILKRRGSTPYKLLACTTGFATPRVGWGIGTADPTSTSTFSAPIHASTAGMSTPYFGCPSTFTRIHVACTTGDRVARMATIPRNLVGEIWTGAAYVACPIRICGLPTATSSALLLSPFVAQGASAAGTAVTTSFDIILAPPAGWATKSIAGQTKYWFRLRGISTTDLASNASNAAMLSGTYVVTNDNRIIHINTWKGRNGAPHIFATKQSAADPSELTYWLDGVALTPSDALQPDAGGGTFSQNTRVWSAYHDKTDRLIGHVSGRGWFYLIPGNGVVYDFEPSNAAGSAYSSLVDGLRAAIPDGNVFALHNGYIFVANGQRISWSGPLEFADVWPNDNEIFLSDADGPITGMASVAGNLVVFKRNSTWVMQSTGDGDSYGADRLMGGLGCIAPDSVAVHGGTCYRLSESGPSRYIDNRDEYINEAIHEYFTSDQPYSSDPSKAVGVYFSTFDQYRLFFPGTASASTLDTALYGDVSVPDDIGWWPQGKHTKLAYGFSATAICADQSGATNTMLIGDVNGAIWQADAGRHDGPSPVGMKLYGAPVGSESAGIRVVRRAAVSVNNLGAQTWNTVARTDSSPANDRVTATSAYKAASAHVVFDTTTTFGSGGATFSDSPRIIVREVNFAVRARQFQIGIESLDSAPLQMLAMQVDVNDMGDKAEA